MSTTRSGVQPRQGTGRVVHRHDASTSTAMTHIAIQEALDGKAITWMEHINDEQYQA